MRHEAPKPVALGLSSKKQLMIPFNFSHLEERIDEGIAVGHESESRGKLVLLDVHSLEPPSSIHRKEPTTDMTKDGNASANAIKLSLTSRQRFCAKVAQHRKNAVSMPELIAKNFIQGRPLRTIAKRMAVPGVSTSCPELAGVCKLQQEY